MQPHETKLACQFLKEAAEVFSNHGSNDFKFPETWTIVQITNFVLEYHQWNEGTEEPVGFSLDNLRLDDYQIMRFLAYKMKKEMDRMEEIMDNLIMEKFNDSGYVSLHFKKKEN